MKITLLRTILITFSVIFSLPAISQAWTKTFGGEDDEEGYTVRQTFDAGYIITGNTYSFGSGNADLYLIRTDGSGDILWTKTYGGTNNDQGVDVQQTTDNGFIITGFTASQGAGNYDVWLVKTDANGDTLWTNTFGGNNNEFGNSVLQTDDGGYTIMGSTESFGAGGSDFWLIKTNAAGELQWDQTYGGIYHDIAFEGAPTSDGGYILAGYTQQEGFFNADVWLVKLDNTGDTAWTRTFGGDLDELANSVQETADAGYIITGYTLSYGSGNQDLWLIKTDMYGDSIWTKTFGGVSNDIGNSVIEIDGSDFLVCGITNSYSQFGDYDIWLIKTDISGDILWTQTYGGTNTEMGYSLNETFNGDLIVTGYTNSSGAGYKDVWLLHLDEDGQVGIDHSSFPASPDFKLDQNYPNPFNSYTTIEYSIPASGIVTLMIYEISGRLVTTLVNKHEKAGNHSIQFEGNHLKEGIYYYRVQSGTYDCTKKFILIR